MNPMLVLLRKDLKDILKSKITYSYLIMPLILSIVYISGAYNLIETLYKQGAEAAVIVSAAQATINSVFSSLPLIVMMLTCSVLASYAVVLDKTKRILESLLATPLSLRQMWLAKSLAVTVPSAVIGIVLSIILIVVINFISFVPSVGFIFPGPLSLITGIILVPVVTFLVVGIVTCLQMIMNNPRLASFVFSLLFLAVFFTSTFFQSGLKLDYSLIYLILSVVLLVINYFMLRLLTKERIVLSSKTL